MADYDDEPIAFDQPRTLNLVGSHGANMVTTAASVSEAPEEVNKQRQQRRGDLVALTGRP